MSERFGLAVLALAAIAATLAQDVVPGLDAYHAWPYATGLAFAALVLVAAAWRERRGGRLGGRRFAFALAGAVAVAAGGLASGLLGPDTITVRGTPGTVTPVPDLGVAAFFGQTDAAGIASGNAAITLRSRTAAPVDVVPGHPVYGSLSVQYLVPAPATFIDAHDLHGNHLTITQPQGTAFLSPILLFPGEQPIHGKSYPIDTFAVPAFSRVVRTLYFSAADTKLFPRADFKGPIVLFSMTGGDGREIGLQIAQSERPVLLGGLVLQATIGTYPRLAVASAPPLALSSIGLAAFLGGLGALSMARRKRIESAEISPTA
jgi:hypothetical protein